MSAAVDWAVRVTDDTIEVAEGVRVYSDGRGSYVVARAGVQELWMKGASPNLQRLLDSVAEVVPALPPPGVKAHLPTFIDTDERRHPHQVPSTALTVGRLIDLAQESVAAEIARAEGIPEPERRAMTAGAGMVVTAIRSVLDAQETAAH